MIFSAVAKTKQKVESIAGFLVLMFLSSGCAKDINVAGSAQACENAESTVKAAQKHYDTIAQTLASGDKNPTIDLDAAVFQALEEAQEQAFEICNRLS